MQDVASVYVDNVFRYGCNGKELNKIYKIVPPVYHGNNSLDIEFSCTADMLGNSDYVHSPIAYVQKCTKCQNDTCTDDSFTYNPSDPCQFDCTKSDNIAYKSCIRQGDY